MLVLQPQQFGARVLIARIQLQNGAHNAQRLFILTRKHGGAEVLIQRMVGRDALGVEPIQCLHCFCIEPWCDGKLMSLAEIHPRLLSAEAQCRHHLQQRRFLLGNLQRLIVAAFGDHGGDHFQAALSFGADACIVRGGGFDGCREQACLQGRTQDFDGLGDGFHGAFLLG